MLASPPPAHLRPQASRRPSPVASAARPRQRRAPHARVCPIPSDSPGAERDQKQAERGGELGLMPWEEPGESWQVPAESDPPPRLPGEAARGKPSSDGPSERRAHTARPPPRGSSSRARGGEEAGAVPRPPPRAAPRQPRGGCRQKPPLPPQSRSRTAAGLAADSARCAASVRLGARRRLSPASSAAQCPARRLQPAAVASCPVRPEGGGGPAPSRGSATGSAPAPRLQLRALRRRRTPRPAPRGREAELGPGPRPHQAGPAQRAGPLCIMSLWAWLGGGESWRGGGCGDRGLR